MLRIGERKIVRHLSKLYISLSKVYPKGLAHSPHSCLLDGGFDEGREIIKQVKVASNELYAGECQAMLPLGASLRRALCLSAILAFPQAALGAMQTEFALRHIRALASLLINEI